MTERIPVPDTRVIPKMRSNKRWKEIHQFLDGRISRLVPDAGISLDELYILMRHDIGVRNSSWLCLNDIAECARAVGMKIDTDVPYMQWKPNGSEKVHR